MGDAISIKYKQASGHDDMLPLQAVNQFPGEWEGRSKHLKFLFRSMEGVSESALRSVEFSVVAEQVVASCSIW